MEATADAAGRQVSLVSRPSSCRQITVRPDGAAPRNICLGVKSGPFLHRERCFSASGATASDEQFRREDIPLHMQAA